MLFRIYLIWLVLAGSHSELLQDPEGPYCQLISLQEINKPSEQEEPFKMSDQDIVKIDSGRHSSQMASYIRSISRGSSTGIGNSSRHSFIAPFGVPLYETKSLPELSASTMGTIPEQQVPLLRIAYLNKPEILVILLAVFFSIISGLIFPIFALLLSSAIKAFYEPADELRKDTKFWCLMFICLGAVNILALPAKSYLFAVAGCKLVNRMRSKCFEKAISMEISWFDQVENSSGAIGARLSADAASIRCLVGDALGLLVQNAATAISGLLIAFTASWQLALIVLVLLPLLGINEYIQAKFMKGFSEETRVSYLYFEVTILLIMQVSTT